jgi:hypothetical protein
MTHPRFARKPAARLAAVILATLPSAALRVQAAEPVRPPVVEYRIEASLDADKHLVAGRERLVWRNPSSDSVSELRFHLYLNAFKNNLSTFMRESGGRLRGDRAGREPGDWGYIDVDSMKTASGEDLKPRARFVQPDGNDPDDETVLAVPLTTPVPPRGEIALTIEFRSRLPKIFARTGYVRDYHLVGQWFPKMGVYEPAGMRGRPAGGWNCHAFHANSEFYADFGDYDVTLDVPARFVVGATGRKVSEEKRGARTVYRYVQENVHDFAWTADPRFVVHEYRFDPAKDVPASWIEKASSELGLPKESLALTPISVRILMQPDHDRAALPRYIEGMRAAVSFYGLWFGAYPYQTLTIVDPPEDGLGSAGMEYPTFITAGTHVRILRWPLAGLKLTENVVVHEFGHEYFYGMSASNEFEEPWLDEGLNTDAEYRTMALAFGPRDFGSLPGGLGASSLDVAHAEYAHLPNLDPIRRRAWEFADGQSYAVNSYMKTGLFMAQLRDEIGPRAFARGERAFFDKWRFRHPSTEDFFRSFSEGAGRDLSAYQKAFVDGTTRLDWQVVSARSASTAPAVGVVEAGGKRTTYDEKGRRGSVKAEKPGGWQSIVLFGNTGDWRRGAAARLAFADGTVIERMLPPAAWVRLRISSKSALAWAAVDPERHNAWDANRLNDSKVLRVGKGAADTHGGAARSKYFGWAAGLASMLSQALWVFAAAVR